jgi:hypothetical protein
MAHNGDEVAFASSLDLQHAEAALGIVEGDALDSPGEHLRRGCPVQVGTVLGHRLRVRLVTLEDTRSGILLPKQERLG